MSDTTPTRRGFLRALAGTAVGLPFLSRAQDLEAAMVRALGSTTVGDGSPAAVAQLREQYMLAPGLSYLNHASIGTVPRAVHEAHVAHLELCETNPSVYVWGPIWREVTEATRSAAAALLACSADDMAITHSTTEGFNLLALGLPLVPGDEVLFSSLNHSSASTPWVRQAEARGFSARRFDFPLDESGTLDAARVLEIHRREIRPETRVLVVPHIDNMIGLRHPISALTAMAKDMGVEWVLVDGAQSGGMIPVELAASGVDAYAMSPHKWIQSPKGLGLFFATEEMRRVLPPMYFKGGISQGTSARRYEDYSTRAWPAVVALGDALDFQAALGEEAKVRRYRQLWTHVRERVEASSGLAWRSPPAWEDGSVIMAVEPVGASAPQVGAWLMEEHSVSVRAFGGGLNALRIAPNTFTEEATLDAALDLASQAPV